MGNINQFQLPTKSPIEGIMQALQAVHAGFGIPTELAQARLANEQAQGAKQANEAESDYAQHVKDLRGDAATPSNSPLASAVKTQSGASPANDDNWTPLSLPLATGLQEFKNKVAQGKIQNTELGMKQTEAADQPRKIQAEKNAGFAAASSEFLSKAEGNIAAHRSLQQAYSLFKTGTPEAMKAGLNALAAGQDTVKRIQEKSGLEQTAPLGLLEKANDLFTEATSGNFSPERVKSAMQILSASDQSNRNALSGYANSIADAHSAGTGIDQKTLAGKLLNPILAGSVAITDKTQLPQQNQSPQGTTPTQNLADYRALKAKLTGFASNPKSKKTNGSTIDTAAH